jgi:iron complex outermembrane receptor protein
MSNFRKALGIVLGASVSLFATAAHAQTETATETEAFDAGDIIVTAQRREQNLQKVPVTISVLTADAAMRLGINSTTDLAASVPGLNITQSFSSPTFYLRGVGHADVNTGQEMPTALYIDGVYVATTVGSIFSFNNIERVEVLKGPQGTLFGRNATGGVIQVVTKTPSHTPSVSASATYGNYDRYELNFYGTTGLSDTLAADLAVYQMDQSDGWGRNVLTGKKVNLGRELSIRSKLFWTPDDRTSVTLTGDYSRQKTDIGTSTAVRPGALGFDGVTTNQGFYNITSEVDDIHTRYHQWGATLNVKHDFDFARIVSISAYHDLREHVVGYDGDGTPFAGLVAGRFAPAKTFTQELQLQSLPGSKIQWIGGLYFLHQKTGTEPLDLSGAAVAPFPGFVFYQTVKQTTKSYAAFAEATVPIIDDDTHFTAGIRYTSDKRRMTGSNADSFGTVYPPVTPQSKRWSRPSWRAVLDHQFNPRIFGYAQYSRGFKSGQFNLIAPGDPPVKPEQLDAFELGLKTKLFDNRLRLNVAGFYYDYKDIQVQTVIPAGTRIVNAASARMKGIDVDFDLAISRDFHLGGGLSYLDGKYKSFENAPFLAPLPTGGNMSFTGDASGNRLVNAPKWQANLNASYVIPSSIGDFTLAGQYAYNSGFFFTADNRPRQHAYDLVNGSIEWRATSREFGVRLWAKNITKEKYVSSSNNISALGDQYAPAPPRTYGGTLFVNFGK